MPTRLTQWMAAWMQRRHPDLRTFSSGTVVETADVESFRFSGDIFDREIYRSALERAGEVRTVIDLGCHAGFFCCYLRHFFGRDDFRGFAIDANVEMLERAERNFERNGIRGIALYLGLVGTTEDTLLQDFYVAPAHLQSSQFGPTRRDPNRALGWTKVEVTVLLPGEIWRNEHGDDLIDLLKIDIAGSEGMLLQSDPALFWQTRCIILRWHKRFVEEGELFPILRDYGFTREELLEPGEETELWFFSRS